MNEKVDIERELMRRKEIIQYLLKRGLKVF
jgi:hypothetical protein